MRARGAILAATAVAVAGCAHTVSGAPVFTDAEPITPLRPDDTGQVLVTAAQVSDIVGARLQVDADQARPVSGSSAVPACSALDSVGMAAFVGDGWSGFRVLLFTDVEHHDRVVAQACDGGQTVVTSLTDRMSASVWELSGR